VEGAHFPKISKVADGWMKLHGAQSPPPPLLVATGGCFLRLNPIGIFELFCNIFCNFHATFSD
jgi:hypothetical protein